MTIKESALNLLDALSDCCGVLQSIEDQLKGKSVAVTAVLQAGRAAMEKAQTATINRESLAAVYLEFTNNYLSIEKFAEHYGLTDDEGLVLFNLARSCHTNPHPDA